MIQFKIKGTEYTVKEPTIRDYYKIQHLFAKQGVDAKVEILSELSECPIKTLKLLDKYQFLTLWNELAEGPLNISDSTPFHKTFMMNDNMYGFLDLDKVSLGEFVDMDILRNDPQSQQKLHMMMAVLYRPAIWITDKWLSVDKYDSDSLEGRAELFMDLPLKYVYGSLNFFLQVSRYLYETTLDYLIKQPETTQAEKEMIEIASQITLELLETGVKSSTTQQEKMLLKLKRLQDLAQLVSLTSLPTAKTELEKKKPFVRKWSSRIKDKITNLIK